MFLTAWSLQPVIQLSRLNYKEAPSTTSLHRNNGGRKWLQLQALMKGAGIFVPENMAKKDDAVQSERNLPDLFLCYFM